MVDESDSRLIWRSLGRGLDRHYPPEREQRDPFDDLLDALSRHDRHNGQNSDAR